MRVLITGGNGQLGTELLYHLKKNKIKSFSFSSKQLDITDKNKCEEVLQDIKPTVIINCAAYTSVDAAEENSDLAFTVNSDALVHLSKLANKYDALLMHISTDYVFSGLQNSEIPEDAITSPLNIYGKSKLLGERNIQAISNNFIIIRTSWVFSEYGNNFFRKMLEKSGEDILKIVSDQFGKPTSTRSLSLAILKILSFYKTSRKRYNEIYHYSNEPTASWYEFAEYIFKRAYDQKKIGKLPTLKQISTDAIDMIAKRPLYSSLDSTKILLTFELKKISWKHEIDLLIKKL